MDVFKEALKKDKDNFFKLLSLGPPNEFRWFSWLSIAIFHNVVIVNIMNY